jgi:hypothetical protein
MILTESMNHLFANLAQGQELKCKSFALLKMVGEPAGTQALPPLSGVRFSAGVGIIFFFWRSLARTQVQYALCRSYVTLY